MKLIPRGTFLCKFCQHALQKKAWCLTPNCHFFRSSPLKSKTSANQKHIEKHSTVCLSNVSYNDEQDDNHNDSNAENKEDDRRVWRRFKGIVSYDGYDYHGWQSQVNECTVQDLLEWRFSTYFKCKINVIGCSRTDARVHAMEQCFHVDLPVHSDARLNKLNDSDLSLFVHKILNSVTKSVCIKSIECVDRSFHSRFSSFGKKYVYSIIQRERCTPFEMRYNYNLNEHDKKEMRLDLNAMQMASQVLVGQHDFTALAVQHDKKHPINKAAFRGEKASPVKDMKEILITSSNDERNVSIHLTASGFLYKMARSIVGTLIEIGLHKMTVREFQCIFQSKVRNKQIITAPAHGLRLEHIFYDEAEWDQVAR